MEGSRFRRMMAQTVCSGGHSPLYPPHRVPHGHLVPRGLAAFTCMSVAFYISLIGGFCFGSHIVVPVQ